MTILAIDTSCDDTAAAVTAGNRVLSNVIWSQASLHARWGGVVPSLAKRAHQDRLSWVVNKAIRDSRLTINDISALAVTVGPGLAPALEAGIHYAKALALLHKIPLIPVNHLEGHTVSAFLKRKSGKPFANNLTMKQFNNFFSLIVSGGHTQLVIIKVQSVDHSEFSIQNSVFKYRLLADTLDDALGEALDKAARMLGLGYPGGAILEKFAKQGDPKKYSLPLPLLGRENQGAFSFSGLKTAFYRLVTRHPDPELVEGEGSRQQICDLAASFQSTAFDHLIRVTRRTLEKEGSDPSTVCSPAAGGAKDGSDPSINLLVGGGVAANTELRKRLRKLAKEFNLKIHFPYSKKLCADNAAMIGLAAQWALARGEVAKTEAEINHIDRQPNLNFESPRHSERSPAAGGAKSRNPAKRYQESPIDPSIKSAYESSPFDPLAQIRMTGRFLGSIVKYDRKMNPIVLIGSSVLGAGFLLLGIFGNTPLNVILGALILFNLIANLKKFRSSR